jgi:hypothetical protein
MNEPRQHASRGKPRRRGVTAEFWRLLAHHRKWWLLPVLMMLFVLGVLVMTQGSAIAPFLYALF